MDGEEEKILKDIEGKVEDVFKVVKNKKTTFDKQVENYEGKQKTKQGLKKKITMVVTTGVTIAFLSTIFAVVNMSNPNIIAGVSIDGVEVSGLSKEESIAKLELMYKDKAANDVAVMYENYQNYINLELVDAKYMAKEAVEEAYLLGRSTNIFANNFDILKTLLFKRQINVDVTYDKDIARQNIVDMEVELPGVLVQSAYMIDGEELKISTGIDGLKIDVDKTLELFEEKLESKENEEMEIPLIVLEAKPDDIDIEQIYKEVYKEAKNAYIEQDPFKINYEVDGVDFDIEEAKVILNQADTEEYVIALNITKAEITIADLGEEAFPDELAVFTTRYDATQENRTTNIEVATSKVNQVVLMPGEIFSFNQALGQRTEANGYMSAPMYEAGEVVDGVGGGICQISSALYNAALLANLEIVERTNHQFTTSYVTAGRDATVVYGVLDFRFKNTRNYPIKIEATMVSGISTVKIQGIKEDEEYKISFTPNIIKVIAYETQYVENPELGMGKEVITQKGVNGQVIETSITKQLNGVSETEVISRDTYNPMTRIVERGTKVEETE